MVNKSHPNRNTFAPLHNAREPPGGLGTYVVGINRTALAATDNVVVDAVLGVGRVVGGTVEFFEIRFVFTKQQFVSFVEVQVVFAVLAVVHLDDPVGHTVHDGFVVKGRVPPRPGIPKGNGGQNCNGCILFSPVVHRHADEHVLLIGLGVLHKNIEVLILIEDTRVHDLVLGLIFTPAGVFLPYFLVGKQILGILVEHFHVGMRGGTIQVIVHFLHVLAMVGLSVGKAKDSLFQHFVLMVPECERQADMLLAIRETANSLLAPAVGFGARHLVGNVVPGIAIPAVILPHGTPLPFRQIGAPFFPTFIILLEGESYLFCAVCHIVVVG